MNCNCDRNLDSTPTANRFCPEYQNLPIYICKNCKKYYIQIVNNNGKFLLEASDGTFLLEVSHNKLLNMWLVASDTMIKRK